MESNGFPGGLTKALPPLRSFDDFAGSGARFDLPRFNDPKRFSSRTTSNLLYYQSNYYVLYLALFTLLLLIYQQAVFSGILAVVLFVVYDRLICVALRMYLPQYQLPLELLLDLVAVYIFSSSLSDIFHVAFVFVLPTSPIVVHACCRLRSVRNKLDRLVSTDTPMHVLLKALNVAISESE